MDKSKIGNIWIENTDIEMITERISVAIEKRFRMVINYANAYSVWIAENDDGFGEILSHADLIHPDGTGVWLASRLLRSPIENRFNFTDSVFEYLKICQDKNWSLFFLGSTDEVLKEAKINLAHKFPRLKIIETRNGYSDLENPLLIDRINKSGADILWVGLGTPLQEKWIGEHCEKLKCPVIQSVGDILSHLAGTKVRGPELMRSVGFEWLVRLISNPLKFFKRYVIGIPAFFIIIARQLLVTGKTK